MKMTIGALLVLGATLSAQAVSPPHLVTAEGARYEYYLGGLQQGHHQFADGGLRGKVVVIGRIGFRRDTTLSFNASRTTGRTWTNVTLHLSDGNVSKMTRTFTLNNLNTPKKLFSNKITWPSFTKAPTTSPAPWNPVLSFPLTANYISQGRNDLLVDFQFLGGTLANGVTWTTTRIQAYYKDAPNVVTYPDFYQGTIKTHGNQNCRDSSQTAVGGIMTADVKSYSKSSSVTARADKFFFEMGSYFTATGKPVIQALSVFGNAAGQNVGTCNSLYLKTLLAMFGGTAGPPTALKLTTLPLIPYNSQAVGVSVWCQTAWADSSTGGLKLTQAVAAKIVAQPPSQTPRKMLWYYTPTRASGFGPYPYYYYNPGVQYAVK